MPLDETTIDEELDDTQVADLEAELPSEEGEPAKPKPEPNSELASALRELREEIKVRKEPTEEKAKPPTPEEQAKRYGIYDPLAQDPKFLRKLWRMPDDLTPEQEEEWMQAYYQFHRGHQQQAMTTAKAILDETLKAELAKLRSEFAPVMEQVTKQKAEAIRLRFDVDYPTLADKKYSKVLAAIASQLHGDFPDEQSYFKALAKEASEALGITLTQTNKRTPMTTPRLPRSSVGGTGGAGGRGQPAPTSDNDIDTLG